MKIEELATATIIKIYSLLYYITIFRRKKMKKKLSLKMFVMPKDLKQFIGRNAL